MPLDNQVLRIFVKNIKIPTIDIIKLKEIFYKAFKIFFFKHIEKQELKGLN
ncbi:hypothetical protein LCGC14_0787390 [marine sediment metagenome]|uniref:Uncharacterized protein n=1 Tax=marine sediment metagenome TaxID=412755 RepID=A0A0F9T0P3_9ZZZZ